MHDTHTSAIQPVPLVTMLLSVGHCLLQNMHSSFKDLPLKMLFFVAGVDLKDDCHTLVTGACPISLGDPVDPHLICHAHCLARSFVEDGDTLLDKCLKTMHAVMSGELDVIQHADAP